MEREQAILLIEPALPFDKDTAGVIIPPSS